MNPEQIALVRRSVAHVPFAALDAGLEARLSQHRPALAARLRGQRTAEIVAAAVALLPWPAALRPVLQQLGARQTARGVGAGDWAAIGNAMVDALAERLGERFDTTTHAAWAEAWTLALPMLQAGALTSAVAVTPSGAPARRPPTVLRSTLTLA